MKNETSASTIFAAKSIGLAMTVCLIALMLWVLSAGMPAGWMPQLTFGQWLLAVWCLRMVVLLVTW